MGTRGQENTSPGTTVFENNGEEGKQGAKELRSKSDGNKSAEEQGNKGAKGSLQLLT